MATIESSIKLRDGMTPTLRNINKALNSVTTAYQKLQNVSANGVGTKNINGATKALGKAQSDLFKAQNQLVKMQSSLDGVRNKTIQNANAQKTHNNSLREGSSSANLLWSKLKGVFSAYMLLQGAKGTVSIADQLTMTNARLNLMTGNLQKTKEVQDQIYESAMRSRAGYLQTADAVAKLRLRAGQIFKTNDEAIAFQETLNKMFVIAGTSASEMYSATLQLTQALGSGVLRGEEFRAVFEAAPNVMQAVADYMDLPIGKLREIANEGAISADIVKNAMFKASKSVDKQFKEIPKTWAQVWTIVKNHTIKATEPILERIRNITKSERFIKFADMIGVVINKLAKYIAGIFDVLSKVIASCFDFVEKNWGVIEGAFDAITLAVTGVYNACIDTYNKLAEWGALEPILWGIESALLGIAAAIAVIKAEAAIGTLIKWFSKLKGLIQTITLFLMYWKSGGLFTAIGALGVGAFGQWAVVIGIVIGLFWLAKRIIEGVTGQTISFFGLVCAVFATLFAFIYNVGVLSWNIVALIITLIATALNTVITAIYDVISFLLNMISAAVQFVVNCFIWLGDNAGIVCENIGIFFQNLGASIKASFYDAISYCLNLLASLVGKLSGIPFIGDKFKGAADSIKGVAKGFKDSSKSIKANKKEYKSLKSFGSIDTEVYKYANPLDVGKHTFDTLNKSLFVDFANYEDWATKAYDWGSGLSFGSSKNPADTMDFDLGKYMNNLTNELAQKTMIPEDLGYTPIPKDLGGSGSKSPYNTDIGKGLTGGFGDTNDALNRIANNTSDIADNTSVSANEEDLSYMRDMATREAINRHTTRNVKIEMVNNNNVSNGMDLETVLKQIAKTVNDSVNASASGVHY